MHPWFFRSVALVLSLTVACGDDDDPAPTDAGSDAGMVDDDAGPPVQLTVEVESGAVQGVEEDGARAFYGIPYAQADERWVPSRAPDSWTEVRDASTPGAVCPQLDLVTMNFEGDEDCLFANVYTPVGAENAPVLFFLHGGAFRSNEGSSQSLRGHALARDHGIVVVTINYRLGVFGFLAHPGFTAEDTMYNSSGNYGMIDIIRGLEWTQRNVAAFGGDPSRVTIAGISSGAEAALATAVSPSAAGLYHRLFASSPGGLILPVQPTLAEAEAKGTDIATALGCSGDDATVVACLRALSTEDAVGASLRVLAGYELKVGGNFYQGNPNPDPSEWSYNVDGTLFTRTYFQAAQAGEAPNVPVVLGNTRDEGTLFHSPITEGTVASEAEYESAVNVAYGANAAAILAEYPASSYGSPNEALVDVTSDAVFRCANRILATWTTNQGIPTYKYLFLVAADSPVLASFGVFHSTDLAFFFDSIDPFNGRVPPDAAELGQQFRQYIANFVTTGDPNDGEVTPAWPQYDAATDQHLEFDVPAATVAAGFNQAKCDFWASLYE